MMFRGGGGWCPFCGGTGAGGGLGGLLMLLFGLLVIAGIVLLVLWAVREFGSGHGERAREQRTVPPSYGPQPPSDSDPAIVAARERYARGEISREELEDILSTLRRTG